MPENEIGEPAPIEETVALLEDHENLNKLPKDE